MSSEAIFQPLKFRNLEIKNRILRSNISGRFDDYDGAGSQTRINWELKFARGGVGAILSAWTAVDERGKIVPSFAGIESDERIPFWRELGERVHEHDCKYVLQLAHAGRQRDIPTLTHGKGLSSTNKPDPLHGFEAERATRADLEAIKRSFAAGARRAREAGLDGVELHGANGYLITQFLSSAINDRKDHYGGVLRNRARFVLEIVRAIRDRVGPAFHLQMKISVQERNDAIETFNRGPSGNTVDESVQVCTWLEEAGVDAIHVSTGSFFPHPRNPAGIDLPVEELEKTFDTMISSGERTFRNYLLFRSLPELARRQWQDNAPKPHEIEGALLSDARHVKAAVGIPVICTGGFQSGSVIAGAIARGDCDAVSIARPLIANNDLVEVFRRGHDRADRPCTYCNRCLVNVVENPLGCYEESRFPSRDAMVAQIMSVFNPPPFV